MLKQFLVPIIILIISASACSFMEGSTSALCDVDRPSIICEIAAKNDTSPEDLAKILKTANVGLLAADVYTAEEANYFIDDMMTYVQAAQAAGTDYGTLGLALLSRYGNLQPEVQAAMVIVSILDLDLTGTGEELLTDYDYELIMLHLENQKKLVEVFLPAI